METVIKSMSRRVITEPKTLQFTMDKDMNVPENLGDIAEITNAVGTIAVEEEKPHGDKIYVRGGLMYQVLYSEEAGGDGFGNLSGRIDFDEIVRIDSEANGIWRVSAKLEDVSVTIIHPRKISVTALVTLSAVCCGESECDMICDIDEPEHVECLLREQTVNDLVYSGRDRLSLSEQIGVMNGSPNISEIIFNTCNLTEWEVSSGNDCYRLTGKLCLFMIYKAEDSDEPYALWEQELAFEREITAEGCDEGCMCHVNPKLGPMSVSVCNDDDGEPRLADVGIELLCDAEIYKEGVLSLLTDAYATDGELELEKRKYQGPVNVSELNAAVKINDRVSLPDGMDDIGEILYTEASVSELSASCDSAGAHVAGVMSITCYYKSNQGNVYVRTLKHDCEFVEHMPQLACKSEEDFDVSENEYMQLSCNACVNYVTVRAAGTGEYEVKAGINLCLLACEIKEFDYVSEVNFTEASAGRKKQIVCYFVKEGEGLFDICRRYKVKQEDIYRWNPELSLGNGSRVYLYTAR